MSSSNEYSGLISFRIDQLDLLAVQGTLKSLLQHHVSKALLTHSSLIILFISVTSVVIFSFVSNFSYFSLLFFFQFNGGVSTFIGLLKKINSWFLDFFYCFSFLYFVYLCYNLYFYSPSANFWFYLLLFFPTSLRRRNKVNLLI